LLSCAVSVKPSPPPMRMRLGWRRIIVTTPHIPKCLKPSLPPYEIRQGSELGEVVTALRRSVNIARQEDRMFEGRLAVSIPEAAKALSISRSFAYAQADSGEIPTIRIGRRRLVPVHLLREKLLLPNATKTYEPEVK
jgi:excisionase family DNA binding protein